MTTLVPDNSKAIAHKFPDTIAFVASVSRGNGNLKYGDKSEPGTSVIGATPEYETVAKYPVEEGRFLNQQDEDGRARSAVIGRTTIENLTGDREQISSVRISRSTKPTSKSWASSRRKGLARFGQDQDDLVIIPCSTAMRRVFNRTYLSEIDVSARTEGDMDLATEEIVNLMRERHKLRPPSPTTTTSTFAARRRS